VLLVATHPVQYAAPVFRQMAAHPRLEIQVAYCSLQGAEAGHDPEFGRDVQWDVPLLDGYPWVRVPNRSLRPGLGRFFGLFNPGLWRLLRKSHFDAVALYTGYRYASFWIALVAAKASGTAVLFGTDAHELRPRDARSWKLSLKGWLWPRLFRLADMVIVPSSGSLALMHSLGLPEERVALTPYTVDNEWWSAQAARADRAATRQEWKIPADAAVVLFCAKLQPWKRPADLLCAFARAAVSDLPTQAGAYLVFAGDGPLKAALEEEARRLGVSERVRFLGFVNQTALPAVYSAADLLVLPSEYEPFAVVVNEAMLCGCAVAVSDRVGARYDLVHPGENGFVFRCGDIEELAAILREVLPDRARLQQMGAAARERMRKWSPAQNIEALVGAVARAVSRNSEEGAPVLHR
jgi:glycosyltransferase involved in cell wall biosynthesis